MSHGSLGTQHDLDALLGVPLTYGTDYPDAGWIDRDGATIGSDDEHGEHADDDETTVQPWPTLPRAALQGLAGRIVHEVAPHTEADPAALLATVLAMFGAMAGDNAYFEVANGRHPARLYPLIVGRTSDGAKGTSWSAVRAVMLAAQPEFEANMTSGLSSGEGLIEAVRDNPDTTLRPDDPNFDEGIADKRLLVIEPEYASVLSRGRRDGSTLLTVLRAAWDGDDLRTLTRKRNGLSATRPHIVVVGHVTPAELQKNLRSTDMAGGTVNRLLLVLSRRSKLLPEGGNVPADVLGRLRNAVAAALAAASRVGPIERTPEAAAMWQDHYSDLQRARPDGPLAQSVSRAAPQVLRLGLAYALLDSSPTVGVDHLTAALALWQYCEKSARWLFTNSVAEAQQPAIDELLRFIESGDDAGVTRRQISDELFSRNKSRDEIDALLAPLIHHGQITQTKDSSGRGRPTTWYRAARRPAPAARSPTDEPP